jgi:threonyl-tRNA synthetase
VIEDGFYYDFKKATPFTPGDLERIESEMRAIVKNDFRVTREEMPREQARALFAEMGEHYKVQIIEGIPDPVVSLYRQGEFVDLCRGPHVPSTGKLRAFKLTSVAGAYWRGDERNEMLQRIYGTAFATPQLLTEHLARIEERRSATIAASARNSTCSPSTWSRRAARFSIPRARSSTTSSSPTCAGSIGATGTTR